MCQSASWLLSMQLARFVCRRERFELFGIYSSRDFSFSERSVIYNHCEPRQISLVLYSLVKFGAYNSYLGVVGH